MSDTIIVALIGLAGSAVGSFCGVLASARLTQYRLQLLEDKVNKHNSVIERTFKLEERSALCAEKFEAINHRIKGLEAGK